MTAQPPPHQPPPPAGEPLHAWPDAGAGTRGGAIVDIDGTLVDTSYQHTVAWGRAFADHGVEVALWRVHRHNGMGGDQLVAAVAGDEVEERLGDAIRAGESRRYRELIDEVRPLPGARDLLGGLGRAGYRIVLASSADPDEVERHVEMLAAHDLVEAWTTAADVDRTKPHPDLIATAAERLNGVHSLVTIGDTAWDAVAAKQAGVPSIGLLSGGFGAAELYDAGCASVYADAAELGLHLTEALATATARTADPGLASGEACAGRSASRR
jgi:phosphoglycolate phosphatase-like HAD superfamily hydrolase